MKAGKKSQAAKWILITICVIFLFTFLVLPLIYILSAAFREGPGGYISAVTDKYAVKAAVLTLKATFFCSGDQYSLRTLCGLVHYKVCIQREKDSVNPDRPAGDGLADHRGSDLYIDLRTPELFVSDPG